MTSKRRLKILTRVKIIGNKIRIGRKIHGCKSKGPLITTATAMTTPASPITTMFMRIRRERLRIRKKNKTDLVGYQRWWMGI